MALTDDLSKLARSANGIFNSVTANATAITSISVGGTSLNSTSFPGTANNATYLNGQLASYYTNASNITTGTLPLARLDANVVNTSAAFTITGVYTYNANLTVNSTSTFNGNTSVPASIITNMVEPTTVSATAATGTINFDTTTQSVLYYTTNASANWTVNFRGSSGTSLNTLLSTGQSISVAFMVTQGATAYFANNHQVDGANVTPKWQGGTAPTAGNAGAIDIYSYTIVKTGSATFTILAAQTQFK